MKRNFSCLLIILLAFGLMSIQASAQKKIPKETTVKAKLDSLSPEQKKAFRQKLKARYDSLPPEEKEKIRQNIMNRVDTMSADQKKKIRKHLRDAKKDNG